MTAISLRENSEMPRPAPGGTPPQRLTLEGPPAQHGIEHGASPCRTWEHDKNVAEALQRTLLLPDGHLTHGELSIEARNEAADRESQIGGDFFDCFPVGDGRLAVAVGDICGSGIGAAAHVPGVKFALRAFLGEHHSPCTALALLNNLLCAQQARSPEQNRSVALSLALIDERTGETECVTAGAEPPLALRLNGGWDAYPTTGMLLGVEPKQPYHSATERLNPGDILVMATDGITEAHIGQSFLGFYGMAYLAVTAYATAPLEPCAIAPHIADSVLSGARAFAGGQLHDDACLVAIRRGGD